MAGHLDAAAAALDRLRNDEHAVAAIAATGSLLADRIRAGGTIYTCGNGGSLCDAMHMAEELTGRFREDRPAYPAIAISDPSHLTCTANDYGYEDVFSRFLQAHAREGDVLVGLSTSGNSANVIRAAEVARDRGAHVVAMTGRPGSTLSALADIEVCVSAGPHADRAQELHIKAIHAIIDVIERSLGHAAAT